MNPKKKIVLVDDDVTSLDIIAFLFEENGFEIERFANGNRAVEYLEENQTNVVLLDLMMPEVDGIETATKIRANGYSGPMIAFTALDDEEVHQAATKAGCNQVVTKPYEGKKLLELVNKWIEN